jgi:hypothetical protein
VRPTATHLLGTLLLAVACNGADDGNAPVATSTHALLRVDRSVRVGSNTEVSGKAFAGVVRVPELADPGLLLRVSGKSPTLPLAGQCAASSREREAAPQEDLARAEFLDAGDVMIGASDVQTLLAPHAIPLDVLGVVYTSRDQAASPLPGGAGYLLKTSGSKQLPPLELRVQAPDELQNVTLAGAAIESLANVNGGADVALSWRPGDARDTVYVEVAGSAEVGSLGVCAFRDSDGRGNLPGSLFGANGAGSVSFHRLREVVADVPTLDGAEVRFDFALTAEVSFR